MNFSNLPQKNEYKFKEVTSLTGVKPYVLRFWETEFVQIKPQIDEAGQKIYSGEDLEFVKKIKELLFAEKLSIPKAKALLDEQLQNQIELDNQTQTPLVEETPLQLAPQEVYTGVEMREAIGNIISAPSVSIDEKKEHLRAELEQQKEQILQKQFNDQDVLRLVQTKKKLNVVLGKLDAIIEEKGWS